MKPVIPAQLWHAQANELAELPDPKLVVFVGHEASLTASPARGSTLCSVAGRRQPHRVLVARHLR